MIDLGDYKYLYETHLHTSVGSACGNNTPEEMVNACKDYGYTGIIITEHNWGGNTAIDTKLPWHDFVDQYYLSYERAKKEGDQIGLQVFFGMEMGYEGTEFLVYGLTKEWLYQNPKLRELDVPGMYRLIKSAGGMVIHAHPFRQEWYIPKIRLYPDSVDGVEGINATHSNSKSTAHNDPEYNIQAIEYAQNHNLPMTAGSDIHSIGLFGGGVAFKRRINDIQDYISAIINGEDYILTDGEKIYG